MKLVAERLEEVNWMTYRTQDTVSMSNVSEEILKKWLKWFEKMAVKTFKDAWFAEKDINLDIYLTD